MPLSDEGVVRDDSLKLSAPLVGDPARMFRVKVIDDAVYTDDAGVSHRLVCFQLTYPRVLLAEINTHRVLSRSSESSRAIPGRVRLRQLKLSPYRPMRWGSRQAGMGAGDDLTGDMAAYASAWWERLLEEALTATQCLIDAGSAKEDLNRVTEPWALCRTVITSSQWDNFFALRTHEAAFLPFRFLARAMYVAYRDHMPLTAEIGDLFLPYIKPDDNQKANEYAMADKAALAPHPMLLNGCTSVRRSWARYHLCRWSAARCARVSYGLLDGKPATPEADDATWAKLVGIEDVQHAARCSPELLSPGEWPYRPIHASPLEHQAMPAFAPDHRALSGNLRGWVQFRKLIGGEQVLKFNPPAEVVQEWRESIPPEVFGGEDIY